MVGGQRAVPANGRSGVAAPEACSDDPRFKALIADLAEGLIKKVERRSRPTQLELLQLAQAHEIRGETEAAAAAIDRGLALGGPLDGELRTLRASLNQARAAR